MSTYQYEEAETDHERAIFTHADNRPVKFYFWGTHQDEQGSNWGLEAGRRDALRAKVLANGGTVCEHAKDADTVIVRRAGLEELRRRYRSLPTRYAEGPDFVKECIRNKKYAHHPVLPRPMGGLPSRGVRQRIEFTYRDEWNLVRYLAVRIPYPETGGRMGNGVYNELMEDARVPDSDFAWALRHTAHSWREHYKNNQKWFDDMIESIVEKNPPPADGKGLYGYSRTVTKRSYEQRMRSDSEDEEEYDPQLRAGPSKRRRRRVFEEEEDEEEDDEEEGAEEEFHLEDIRNTPQEEDEFEPTPGPEDAGPSHTQHSPPIVAKMPPPPVPAKTSRNPPAPRPARRPQVSQMPMSSQATLVGNAVSQIPQPRTSQPKKKRKIMNYVQVPEGIPHDQVQSEEPPRRTGRGGKGKERALPEEDYEFETGRDPVDQDELAVQDLLEDVVLSSQRRHSRGQKAQDVFVVDSEEEFEVSSQDLEADEGLEEYEFVADSTEFETAPQELKEENISEEFETAPQEFELRRRPREEDEGDEDATEEEETDSDDQRMIQNLGLPSRPRGGPVRRPVPQREEEEESDDDDESFAASLNLLGTISTPPLRPTPTLAQKPAEPALPTPFAARTRQGQQRQRAVARMSSSESAVPLRGTTASVVKKTLEREALEAESYVPPAGTRASQETRRRAREAQERSGRDLRSRRVPR